jgi:hypothetical protein
MEVWEFLIQREGDRGWRPIKTGNLQLTEGKYRIVANSNLVDTQIHTRVTHQNLGAILPQRKSQAREQSTNARGLVVIVPSTQLESGLWQFVCSGDRADGSTWHRILKLRVLPRTQPKSPVEPVSSSTSPNQMPRDLSGEVPAPTEPLIPMTLTGTQENWADGLDRLLEQLEQDSLKPRQQVEIDPVPNLLQLTALAEPPLRLINLDRSAFSGMIPGNRLMINGSCNLQLFSADLVHKVQISKLLICLRHPQTAAVVVSIEQPIAQNLDMFAFRGQIQLPIEVTTTLLMGEVNLYDRHNIQVGTTGFTVTIDLDPVHESELSFLQLLDIDDNEEDAHHILDRLSKELKLETAFTQPVTPAVSSAPSPIQNLTSSAYPSVPVAYQRESLVAKQATVAPTSPLQSKFPQPSPPVTGDLDLNFDSLPQIDKPHRDRHWDTLEVVVD